MVSWRTLLPLVGASLCAAQVPSNQTTETVHGSFIVEFEGNQTPDAFYSELLSKDGFEVVPRLTLNYKLFNGASFAIKGLSDENATLAKIEAYNMVKTVWPVRRVSAPNDTVVATGQSDIAKAFAGNPSAVKRDLGDVKYDIHIMTQVDRLHAAGYTGKGVKIGIIDSGVDYMHPDLGGCFGPGCVVTYGHDFIGGTTIINPVEDDDPLDTCMGHGTHVAGILASKPSHLGFVGVAPDAELGMFRALDCFGSSTNDILLAAFNMAFEQGSHIISASVGIDGGWPDDAWSMMAQRIVENGVSVVVAAGNDGELGIFRPSNPAAGRGVASVASIDARELPTLLLAGTYESGESAEEKDFGWIAGYPRFENLTLPLYYVGSDADTGNACEALPEGSPDLTGYLVLVKEDDCHVDTQAANIIAKGARNLLYFRSGVDQPEAHSSWAENIEGFGRTTGTQGEAFAKELLQGANITVTITNPDVSRQIVNLRPNEVTPGYTSFWSSWGPDWELNVNPTAAAPGGQILSTFPLALGSYSVEEGTSMACPLVAGAMALIGQVRGTFDPETLRAAVATTSRPIVFHDGQNADPQGRLAPVPQGGPGILQAWDAAHIKTVVSKAAISFNDTEGITDVRFSVTNLDDKDTTFALGNIPALTVYSFEEGGKRIPAFPPPIADGAEAELDFSGDAVSGDSVTVKAGQTVEVIVGATPPGIVNAERLPVYSGFLSLNGTNGEHLTIPYMGVAASMRDDTKFFYTDIPTGVYMSSTNQRWPIPIAADTTFTGPRPDTPDVNVWSFDWPQARVLVNVGSRHVRLDVVPASNSTATELPRTNWLGHSSVGQVAGFPFKHVTRASFRGSFNGLLADGKVVPSGRYRLVASALKLFGDNANPEDWEKVVLDPFIINYSN